MRAIIVTSPCSSGLRRNDDRPVAKAGWNFSNRIGGYRDFVEQTPGLTLPAAPAVLPAAMAAISVVMMCRLALPERRRRRSRSLSFATRAQDTPYRATDNQASAIGASAAPRP